MTVEACGHEGDVDETGLCKICYWMECGPWTPEQIDDMNELLGYEYEEQS
jgi:hypothetical protein